MHLNNIYTIKIHCFNKGDFFKGDRRDPCKLGHVVNKYCRVCLIDLLTYPNTISTNLKYQVIYYTYTRNWLGDRIFEDGMITM